MTAVAAVAGALALAPPGVAATSSGGPVGVAGAKAPTSARTVTLITGDRVRVTTAAGRTSAAVVHAASKGPASAVSTTQLGGRTYAVPAVARPYLGRYLDPSLFDVASAAGSGDRVLVDLDYTGSARPSVPGVTLTSAAAGHASGYLTPASAAAFGAALSRQAVADSAADWPAHSALFGSVTHIAAAGSGHVVTPSFPMKTLIIKAISHTGKPLRSGSGLLMNSDDGRRYGGFFFLDQGEARVSVPTGHYTLIMSEDRFTPTAFTSRLMVATDYTVSGSDQTLTLDARRATAGPPSATTPKPALIEDLALTILAEDAKGIGSLSYGLDATPGLAKVFLPPTPEPRYGTLEEQTTLNARDTSVPGGAYRFDGGWVDRGIPTDQSHAAPALSKMARVDTTYYTDIPQRTGGTSRAIFLPGSFFVFSSIFPTPMPLTRAEYAFGPKGTLFSDSVLGNYDNFDDPSWFDQEPQLLPAGLHTSTTWLRNPLEQNVPDPAPRSAYPTTVACRSTTSLTLALELLDNVPSHVGEVYGDPSGDPVAHFTLTRNGRTLLDQDDTLGATVDVPSGSATYRAVATIDRRLAQSYLSTATTTDVSFVSGGSGGAATPAGWYCPSDEGTGTTLLPVLRALVDLGGTTYGTVPVGTSRFDVQVGHPASAGGAKVTSVSVEVAPSGSGTWTSLPVSATGGGHYAAAFTARTWQLGRVLDLRVNATDAAGGVLHQTTTRAFTIGS